MSRSFLVASVLGLALCLAFPYLLPFVLAGIVVGLSIAHLPALTTWGESLWKRFRRDSSSSRSARKTGFVAAAAVILSEADLRSGSSGPSAPMERGGNGEARPPLRIVLPAIYRGEAAYRDNPERLAVVDRLFLPLGAMRRMAGEYSSIVGGGPGRAKPHELETDVSHRLEAAGWRFSIRSTEGDTYTRRRHVLLHVDSLPAETGNQIPLPKLSTLEGNGGGRISLHREPDSVMLLSGPAKTFGATYPPGATAHLLTSEKDEVRVRLGDATAVEVDVRSPLFRGGLLSWILGVASSLGVWLFGIFTTLLISLLTPPVQARMRKLLKRVSAAAHRVARAPSKA